VNLFSCVTNNHSRLIPVPMTHIGKNTKSTIVSKGISAGHGQNSYRGLVKVLKNAQMREYSHAILCYRIMRCSYFPYLEVDNSLLLLNMRQQLQKSEKIRFSTATSGVSQLKMR